MTRTDDMRLNGRWPEFSRMSLRPGIGHGMMHEVASTLMQFNLEHAEADVPVSLRHGKRLLPLGRYLRKTLRTMVGKEENAPEIVLELAKLELQDLLKNQGMDITKLPPDAKKLAIRDALLTASEGDYNQMLALSRIMKKRGSI